MFATAQVLEHGIEGMETLDISSSLKFLVLVSISGALLRHFLIVIYFIDIRTYVLVILLERDRSTY